MFSTKASLSLLLALAMSPFEIPFLMEEAYSFTNDFTSTFFLSSASIDSFIFLTAFMNLNSLDRTLSSLINFTTSLTAFLFVFISLGSSLSNIWFNTPKLDVFSSSFRDSFSLMLDTVSSNIPLADSYALKSPLDNDSAIRDV